MTVFKKILLAVLFVAIFSNSYGATNEPALKIVRTDVDTIREGFITACYKFGFDVIAENTFNCNGVSFDLVYNQSDYIKFSGYEVRDLKTVYVNHNELSSGYARVAVGAASGDKAWEKAIDEPIAVHLEFVVVASALDYDVSQVFAEFEFQKPGAVVIQDSGAITISLPVKKLNYKIHGFIDVYPGDADNNGLVDTRDYLPIDRHNGTGALTKKFRSFKRKNPSTLWFAQPALRWDSAAVTYSDCDGNGDITIADGLITSANMDKTHDAVTGFMGIKSNYDYFLAEPIAEVGDIRIPIKISSDKEFIALTGRCIPQVDGYKIKGIEAGDFFNGAPTILSKISKDGNSVEFLISHTGDRVAEQNGIAGYLVLEGNNNIIPDVKIDNLIAVNNSSQIFDIKAESISSVEDWNSEEIKYFDNQLLIDGYNVNSQLAVFDYLGNKMIMQNITTSANIDLSGLSAGMYIAVLQKNNMLIKKKFIITR